MQKGGSSMECQFLWTWILRKPILLVATVISVVIFLSLSLRMIFLMPKTREDLRHYESLETNNKHYPNSNHHSQRGARSNLESLNLPPNTQDFNRPSDHDYDLLPSQSGKMIDRQLLTFLTDQLDGWTTEREREGMCKRDITFAEIFREKYGEALASDGSWNQFYREISSCELYRELSPQVTDLLRDLQTMPIKHAENLDSGTQLKLLLTFENGMNAIAKPMRFSREYEVDPNHFYFSEYERSNAEIAAFHLDKVLKLRHAVPTVGRVLNLTDIVWRRGDEELTRTFFISPAGNKCFYGKCTYFCDSRHPVCGNPELKEFSVQVWIPEEMDVENNRESGESSRERPAIHGKNIPCHSIRFLKRKRYKSPYRRTYSRNKLKAKWQKNPEYCEEIVKRLPEYHKGRRLLDLTEVSIFDFLSGNQDRHHYETFRIFHELTYPVYYDNGRGFGRPKWDDLDIIAPLHQCCVIRPSLLRVLLQFYGGQKTLSEALHESMKADLTAPILKISHFTALERRLEIILRIVEDCIRLNHGDSTEVIRTKFKSHVSRSSKSVNCVPKGTTTKQNVTCIRTGGQSFRPRFH